MDTSKPLSTDSRRHCIVSDEDGHSFVIPLDRMEAWEQWVYSDDGLDGATPPLFARPINGPISKVIFSAYEIS